MTESKAINLCIHHKDPIGFEFLVRKYQKRAYFHGLTFMGNPEEATDACQEAFFKAFVAMPNLESLTQFYPWYYTILKNHCFNVLKRKNKGEEVRKNIKDTSILESKTAHTLLEKTEDKKHIWFVLQELKPEFREILVLKHMEELSYDEISKTLNIPRGTVMSRLYHARMAFKKEFQKTSGRKNEGL